MAKIETRKAPAALGPYSQAISTGELLFLSGQLGLNPETETLPDGIEAQTKQAILNIGAILNEAGANYGDVVKTTCYLSDIGNFAAMNKIYAEYFTENPARSCVEVAALPKGALVEIEAIAHLKK